MRKVTKGNVTMKVGLHARSGTGPDFKSPMDVSFGSLKIAVGFRRASTIPEHVGTVLQRCQFDSVGVLQVMKRLILDIDDPIYLGTSRGC